MSFNYNVKKIIFCPESSEYFAYQTDFIFILIGHVACGSFSYGVYQAAAFNQECADLSHFSVVCRFGEKFFCLRKFYFANEAESDAKL